MLVQYRLALYSILIGLLNAMLACKLPLFLLATIGLSHCLVERFSLVDWSISFSVMWRNSFTIGGNFVVYQSAPVVDLCRRCFPVGNVVLLPVEGLFVELPLVSPWTRFLTNRLTQTHFYKCQVNSAHGVENRLTQTHFYKCQVNSAHGVENIDNKQ